MTLGMRSPVLFKRRLQKGFYSRLVDPLDAVLIAGVKNVAEIFLDDWTEVDGIKMPFTVTQLLPWLSLVFSFSEVKHET